MDEALIANWNSVVKKDDLIYHLGDFAFTKTEYGFDSYLKRLNGLIVLVKGNHDHIAWQNREKFYSYSDSYREITCRDKSITLCHYAMRVWNQSHRGAWHLYGHTHNTLPDDPHALSIDVGVDCHNYFPISFEKVQEIMSKKTFKDPLIRTPITQG